MMIEVLWSLFYLPRATAPRAATLTKPMPPKRAADWAAVRAVVVVDR